MRDSRPARHATSRAATTIHLHFEIKAPVATGHGAAVMFVPPHSSLVDGYGRLPNGAG